jgi:hypothetical protein
MFRALTNAKAIALALRYKERRAELEPRQVELFGLHRGAWVSNDPLLTPAKWGSNENVFVCCLLFFVFVCETVVFVHTTPIWLIGVLRTRRFSTAGASVISRGNS